MSHRNLRKGPSGLADEINFEDFLTIMSYFRPIDTTLGEEQVELSRKEKLRCASPRPPAATSSNPCGRRVGHAWKGGSARVPVWPVPKRAGCACPSSQVTSGGLVVNGPAVGGFLGLEGATGFDSATPVSGSMALELKPGRGGAIYRHMWHQGLGAPSARVTLPRQGLQKASLRPGGATNVT